MVLGIGIGIGIGIGLGFVLYKFDMFGFYLVILVGDQSLLWHVCWNYGHGRYYSDVLWEFGFLLYVRDLDLV